MLERVIGVLERLAVTEGLKLRLERTLIEPLTLSPLLTKLRTRSAINDEEAELPFKVKTLAAGSYIVREGDKADNTCVLLKGFAYRQKVVGDGGRQIVALQVPGDAVDLQNSLLKIADHGVQALAEVTTAEIPRAAILKITADHSAIAHAFWLDTLVDGSIAWKWITNIGRRDARMRLAHLLCEWAKCLEVVGYEVDEPLRFPTRTRYIRGRSPLVLATVNGPFIGSRMGAVAVLVTRIAVALVDSRGVSARPFLVAVMMAGSAAFATPFGC